MSLDDRTRTWQLIMTGDDLRHVTLETQADMARLLDFDPSISHLTLEIGDDRVHVARDWPSDQYEEADRLIDQLGEPSSVITLTGGLRRAYLYRHLNAVFILEKRVVVSYGIYDAAAGDPFAEGDDPLGV